MEALKSKVRTEIDKLSKEDLVPPKKEAPVSLLPEPTSAEILQMASLFRLGKSPVDIQLAVQRKQGGDSLCFSIEQISAVQEVWAEIVAEKTASEELPIDEQPDLGKP